MAVFVATNGYLLLNSVDLSDHLESIHLEWEADEVDQTNFGSSGNQQILPGIKKAKLTLVFQQDYAAAKVDATVYAAFGTIVAFETRPTSASVSATNPKYTGNVVISKYQPVPVKIGDLSKVSVSWPVTAGLTRATS